MARVIVVKSEPAAEMRRPKKEAGEDILTYEAKG